MGSKWRKAKLALGLKLCVYVPPTLEDSPPSLDTTHSDAALLSSRPMMTPSPAASPCSRLLRSGSRSAKKTCSICLATMKPGDGHAIFTAECAHSFHFHCIASNVKHGNQICPVCRAKWKEIPLRFPDLNPSPRKTRSNHLDLPQIPPPSNRTIMPPYKAPEPGFFDDDESLDHQFHFPEKNSSTENSESLRTIELQTYPEVSSIPWFNSLDNFSVLIHLKAASMKREKRGPQTKNSIKSSQISRPERAPVDLVTVLDISGSMAGTKLALLKRAMGFVIQNLGSNDRLSVIAFSSTARRLFPLRRMSDLGRHQALQAVNSLIANGGTNIAEGLKKGAKVMENRKEKNPVASIILLSDGQDTYTINASVGTQNQANYSSLLPVSIRLGDNTGFQIPVHAFGFGADHDASSMHSISETSGGTFSFIETEGVMQDAFAQCIGGLLSVVVQKLQVGVECVHPNLRLGPLKTGNYHTHLMLDGRTGFIDVGDMYADEERDFLVSVNVPEECFSSATTLLKVKCSFKDPLTKETVTLEDEEVRIKRSEIDGQEAVLSIEVDRQKSRLQAAEAISEARASAEKGDLANAVSILENFRRVLSDTISYKSHDRLCLSLDVELKEMQERMASRHVYEASGRAYLLSGLSSHSWQRATARGDSTDGSSLVQAYQTPSMIDMVNRSQATLLGSPSVKRFVRPAWLASPPKPR